MKLGQIKREETHRSLQKKKKKKLLFSVLKKAQGKSGCFGRDSPLYSVLHANHRTLIRIVLMPRPLAAVSCCGPDQLPQPSGLADSYNLLRSRSMLYSRR